MIRTTKLPCPRCKAEPHRRELRGTSYWCHECELPYPDWCESEAQAAILAALRRHPLVARVDVDNASDDRGRRKGRKNNPDLRGHLKNGLALYVEVKTHSALNAPDKDRFERQKKRLAEARACGCVAFVAFGPWDIERELAAVEAAHDRR